VMKKLLNMGRLYIDQEFVNNLDIQSKSLQTFLGSQFRFCVLIVLLVRFHVLW
jgi:hypothetical protein